MGGIEITAAAIVTAISLVGGWVWRLSWRLASQEGRITAAATAASNAMARTTILEQELSDHRAHVAAEYVSRDSMKEVTDAINRLGDRLDNLFLHFISKAE